MLRPLKIREKCSQGRNGTLEGLTLLSVGMSNTITFIFTNQFHRKYNDWIEKHKIKQSY
jgi:hypothetical protein